MMKKKKLKNSYYTNAQKRLSLSIENKSSDDIPKSTDFFKWVFETMNRQYSYAQIGILLCDSEEAREFNNHYRQKDYATNVLSFPLNFENEQHKLRGDIIICPKVVVKEAAEQGKILTAHYAHLVVHGVLHLMGYDHEENQAATAMENLEIKILNSLGYKNPYLEE